MEAFVRNWQARWDTFVEAVYPLLDNFSKVSRLAWGWAAERPVILRLVIIAASVIAATVLGSVFRNELHAQGQLLLFLPAVMVSALYGGVLVGTIASFMGGLAAWFYFMGPAHSTAKVANVAVTDGYSLESDLILLVLYAIACAIVLGLANAQEKQKEQIRRLADDLEERILERTSDLRKANDELAEFCYSISHDLRAPMRNIVATSEMLVEDLGPSLESINRDQLAGLGASAKRLSKLVDDLLTHARLSSTSIKPQWVSVTSLADSIVQQLRKERWDFRLLNCRIQPGMMATADKQLLRMVLENLMENACKYARKGEILDLEITEKRIKGAPCYCVRDNGIGFDMQYVDKIFQPFQRLHRESEYPGTGIGLANAKRIVERHGGRIWAESNPGEGATFYFTLKEEAKATAGMLL